MNTQSWFHSAKGLHARLILSSLLVILAPLPMDAAPAKIALVTDGMVARPVQHGLDKLKLALKQKGGTATEMPGLTEGRSATL